MDSSQEFDGNWDPSDVYECHHRKIVDPNYSYQYTNIWDIHKYMLVYL